LLAGVLVRDEAFQAGVDAPDYVMVVDKRTVKFGRRKELREQISWRGGEVRQAEVVEGLLAALDAEDLRGRQGWIKFGTRVRRVEALLPDGTKACLERGSDGRIVLPALRGGEGVLLKIEAERMQRSTVLPEAVVWAAPTKWKFTLDGAEKGRQEKWFGPSFDDSEWKEIRIDKDGGWTSQGYGRHLGLGWYRKRIRVPENLDAKHLYVHVGAVDEEAWVYVDGKMVFEHTTDSMKLGLEHVWTSPFAVDCRELLRPGGEHTIAILVRNGYGAGGIYLPIHLIASESELDRDQMWRIMKSRLYE